ncbi:MAG: hypothetical protein ACXVPY_13440 [Bacteroidia bacterium]
MAVGISYQKLFNTRITHTFYEGGISKNDLAVIPTATTALAMKNSNMLFRNDEEGFRVLYKADDSGNAFIDFKNVRLVFGLQLVNVTSFLNFTNLDDSINSKTYSAGKILYFKNFDNSLNTQGSNLFYSLIDYLRPVVFTYQFPQTASGPSDLGYIIIKDQAGNVVTPVYPPSTSIIPDNNSGYTYPIDFTKMPKGLYKFETWTDSTSTQPHVIESIYIDNELAGQNIFGIIDILAKDAAPGNYPVYPPVAQPLPPIPQITEARVYDMNFVRRLTQWKYILVLKSPGVNPVPSIIGIVDDAPQSPYGTLLFTSPPVDAIVNGFPAKIFASDSTTIPYFEVPKKGLSVKKDTGLATTVLTDIKGPPIGVVSAQTSPTKNFNITEIFVII